MDMLQGGCQEFRKKLFTGDDSLAGANACAGTAVDANIGVDNIDIAFRDSLNGTFGETSAASNTRVCNYVSHCCKILVGINALFVLRCKSNDLYLSLQYLQKFF